jgi:hypothetical protein
MITTSQGDVGAHFGHVIVSGPRVPRTYFFTGNQFPQESEFVAAIRGELSNGAVSDPSDVRGVQGGNTVKLGRGKTTDLWVAVVAGDNRPQTVANAQAAIADATARIQRGNTLSASAGGMTRVRSMGGQAQSSQLRPSGPICKAGCGLD